MITEIHEVVSVNLIYNHEDATHIPKHIKWRGRVHTITKVGYHHKYKEGVTLHHIFSVTDGTTSFRLNLNTDNLIWTLERVSDGNER